MKYKLVLFSLTILLTSCGKKTNDMEKTEKSFANRSTSNTLFVRVSSTESGINFSNQVEDGEKFNVLTYRNFYNGAGVSIGDINNDGLADIYFTANMHENRLFLNKGNWKFEDITEKAGVAGKQGWSTGTTMADVNGDGLLDIYVCNSGDLEGDNKENELFINQGNLTFKESAASYGLNDKGFSTHASFFDYDNDGDLDCYVLNNSFKDVRKFDIKPDARNVRDVMGGDKLYRNDGERFTDVSEAANIYGVNIGYGLGVTVGDVNGDLYPDMYISNDFFERDYLYINQRNGTFKEELPSWIGHTSTSSMGADMADINNDGLLDIFSTDMLPEDDYRLKTMIRFDEYSVENIKYRSNFHYQYAQNGLQLNSGSNRFNEISFLAGIGATDWSWGALIFDFENDGWKDILVSNGIYRDITSMDFTDFLGNRSNVEKIVTKRGKFDFRDFLPYLPSTKISNYAFVNNRNLTFENKAHALGLGEPSFSNGSAYGDLDNDGDLDIVVNNENMECFIYRNDADKIEKNNYLKIELKGKGKNPFGVGTEVRIFHGSDKQVLQQMPSRSFESSVEPRLNFGIGKVTEIDSLVVIWPDHSMEILQHVKPNQKLVLHQNQAKLKFSPPSNKGSVVFKDVTESVLGKVITTENIYNDFNYERLLPHMLSTEGPKLATGDVNGDKLQDVFIGGAKNSSGLIYTQTKAGKFIRSKQSDLENDARFEDTCAAFFDMDGDGDLDLIVGSGGGEMQEGTVGLSARLYTNDGKGNFKASPERSPRVSVNASCILPYDVDQDGDIDLFIGGRNVTNNYGANPRSYLLINEPSGFVDGTPEEMKNVGMVTAALWSDFTQDGIKDLIIVGEWMPITFFKNINKKLTLDAGIDNSTGWWNSIVEADLDSDGDADYVVGNWGLNSKFKASVEHPIELHVKDFDQNGTPEPIISHYTSDGNSYIFHSKGDMTSQIPSLKKKFLKYSDYATKSYEQVFTEEQRKGAIHKQVVTLASAIVVNTKGKFSLDTLPIEAQVAPVFGIVVDDFNHDNKMDILLTGNYFSLKPEIGRMDANLGVLLWGGDNRIFKPATTVETGIKILGEVRDMKSIPDANGKKVIFLAKNNEAIQIIKPNK